MPKKSSLKSKSLVKSINKSSSIKKLESVIEVSDEEEDEIQRTEY